MFHYKVALDKSAKINNYTKQKITIQTWIKFLNFRWDASFQLQCYQYAHVSPLACTACIIRNTFSLEIKMMQYIVSTNSQDAATDWSQDSALRYKNFLGEYQKAETWNIPVYDLSTMRAGAIIL